jgi:hypothetical protein
LVVVNKIVGGLVLAVVGGSSNGGAIPRLPQLIEVLHEVRPLDQFHHLPGRATDQQPGLTHVARTEFLGL